MKDVLMPQMALDFNFSAELYLHFRFDELLFVQDLQRDNELGLLLPCKVDVAKLPFPKRLADFKVVDGPLSWIEFERFCRFGVFMVHRLVFLCLVL